MKLQLLKGTASKLLRVFIMDTTSGTGAGLTGLVFNSASLSAYYIREGAASATSITLATMTLGTWATGGFVVVDGTNMPGLYELGIPDAALATGANSVVVMLKGATNMAPVLIEIQLQNMDPYSTLESLNLHSGTAQAGGASTITLAASANAVTNDIYRNEIVKIYGGTGAGQARKIQSYVAATRVATVDGAWAVNPDNTSTYAVLALVPDTTRNIR